jgi:hypothetical protein
LVSFSKINKLFTLGDFEGLYLVRHKHKRRPENNDIKVVVRVLGFYVVEVELPDGHIFMLSEQLLTGWNIALIDIDAENLGLSEFIDDAVKRVSSGGSNVQYFLDVLSLGGSLPDKSVGCSEIEIEVTW